jgi:TrmH family RNA methyltransferase
VIAVTPELLGRIAFGDRADGIVAVAEAPDLDLRRLELSPDPLVGVLVGVEKPGNVGAVLRTADGAGVSALLIADPGTDLHNPNCIRASLGTVFTVPVATAGSATVLEWLRAHHVRVITTRVDAGRAYTAADLTGSVAIVLGSEADGLPDEWSGPDVEAVSVPMLGVADSLNVSVTGAILFYEARRQRSLKAR